MYFDYIEIENFRPYKGLKRIDFGYNEKENITVVLADNNSGKTSLVNALTWCLYGKELHDTKNKKKPIYNTLAAKEQEKTDSRMKEVKVQVKIRFYDFFEDDDGELKKEYFTVTRSQVFQNFKNTGWTPALNGYLCVNDLEDEEAQQEIEDKIPESMFQYFFFNGATLYDYFDEGSGLNLKKSINNISQIDLIDNAYNHFDGCLDDFIKDKNKLKPKSQVNYSELIKEKKVEINSKKNEIKFNNERLELAKKNVAKYTSKLTELGSKDIDDLLEKKKNLDNDKSRIRSSISKKKKSYEKLILELFPIAAIFDDLVKAIEITNDAKKKGIPSQMEKELLKTIIESGYCICGMKLEDNPDCVEELQKRLDKTSDVSNDEFYGYYYDTLKIMKKLYRLEDIDKIKNEINSSKKTLASIERSIDDINDDLKDHDEDRVKFYQNQLLKNENKIVDYEKENRKLNSEIKESKEKVSKYKAQRDRDNENASKRDVLDEKIKITEEAMDATFNLKGKVNDYIREKINSKTKDQFTSIKWEDYDKYTDVSIERDYSINITEVTEEGEDIIGPGDLSDGAGNLLALSFIMALHSIQGFEIPLIIDAPFEKLDKKRRIEFIDGLHAYTEDKQIVFLFTDTQYTPDVRTHMYEHVCDEYELKSNRGNTEIVKHVKQ